MDLNTYLERICFKDRPRVDLETLISVHRHHLLAIPYENLDVLLKQPLSLDVKRIYSKIVEQGRGGWCYEMNGLLGWALEQMGFDVMRISAGVLRVERGPDAMGNHLMLCVTLDEPWVADVGLGDGTLAPYPLKPHTIEQLGFQYRLEKLEDFWRFHNHHQSTTRSFDFYCQEADENQLVQKCHWLSTDPDSQFTKNLVCQRWTSAGYDIQVGRVSKLITPAGVTEKLIDSADELVESLRRRFDLDVPGVAALWQDIWDRHQEIMARKAIQ